MKAVKSSLPLSKTVLPVRLYIEDIDEILGIIQQAGLVATIADGSNEYENLQELVEHRGNQPSKLFIRSKPTETRSWEWFNIEFQSSKPVTLSIKGESQAMDASSIRIERLIESRRGFHSWLLRPWRAWLVIWLMQTLLGVIQLFGKVSIPRPAWIGLLGVPAAYWLLSLIWVWRYPRIILSKRHEATSFVSRHMDSLLISLLSAVAGGIITKVIDALF